MAAALLTGFALFQGIVWPAWWMLLLSFLPWPLARSAAASQRLRHVFDHLRVAAGVRGKGNLKYRVVIGGADGREFELADCVLNESAARRIAPIDSVQQLSTVLSDHECAEPGSVRTVTLFGDRRVFDFEARQFSWRRAVKTVGPIRVK